MQCSSNVSSEPPRADPAPSAIVTQFGASHDMSLRPTPRTHHGSGVRSGDHLQSARRQQAKIRKQIARAGNSSSTDSLKWPFRGSQFVSNDFKRTTLQLMAERLASGVLTSTASARSGTNNNVCAQNPSPPRRKFIWHTTLVEDARKAAGGAPTTITTTSMTTANHTTMTMMSPPNTSNPKCNNSSQNSQTSIPLPPLAVALMPTQTSPLTKAPGIESVRSNTSTQITDWKMAVRPRNGNRREGILARGTIQQQGRTAHSHTASALCELFPHIADSKLKDVTSFDYYFVTPMEHGRIHLNGNEERCCTLPSFDELLLSLDLQLTDK